ncbi:MAG TPA: SMC family ATPase [Anaerolineae bacterium]|nr:SMC family ATPase [Anaerolineae bacterium]HQI84503.1 SMC family ATPase [Anaerolineae bacterium]
MIPEELHLRNFLSHRETDLDFRGVHLASLVGENGAGKSALLDAITWAVWGRSRAPYGRDEDLVYHGEDTIEVEYVFRMPYQGGDERRCRILRRRERQGRRSTGSVLDFQVQGDNGWRILTADSIRETQNRIVEQLGLDYDTFINSAYLRQGHADEFTIQTSSDRKRVLSAILGLERWVEYQERAKKRLSSAQGRLQEVDRRLDETTQELARRPEYEAQLAEAERQARDAEARLAEIQTQVDKITRIQEQALALRRHIADLDERLQQEKTRLAQQRSEEEMHQGQHAYYAAMLDQADVIETNYRAYQIAVGEERAWGEKLGQAARLQSEKAQWEGVIAAEREKLNKQLRAADQEIARLDHAIAENRARMERALSDLQGQITLLRERTVDPALLADLEAARAELAHLEHITQEQEAVRAALQAGEVERTRLVERNRQLRDLMNEAKSRIEALAEAEAACPLCRQPLTPEHQERLLTEIQAEGETMGDEHRANATRIQALQGEKTTLQQRVQEYDKLLHARPRQEQTVARLQQQIEQSDTARERIAELQAQAEIVMQHIAAEAYADAERDKRAQAIERLNAHQARLDQEDYAAEARAALADVLAALGELGYDAAAHQDVKNRIQALSSAEADYRELEKARVSLEKEAETLKRLALEIEVQQGRIAKLNDERAAQETALDALRPALAEAPRLEYQLNQARQQESLARQRVGAARQNLTALQTLERRLTDMRAQREELAQRVGMLAELRDAFGVNGIPAMIIEHTLPELEREANHILQSLTGGRMHVRLETQRETKTGNLRETLDIIISDEKGARPYENYSGGEQFRVNFAIRVALSRMLAQRAGVRLRSLFVDEGFGSLDAEGRQRLVEAVKTVQHEFDLILVITHIDELREAFPTQIQVTKGEGGSVVEVV